jgi:hypothetical protein
MTTFDGLLASRLFGCIGMSPFEVLVTATITDMYFPISHLNLTTVTLCTNVVSVLRHGDYVCQSESARPELFLAT